MLIEFAIADAYGAGFEFRDEAFVREHNDGITYRKHALLPLPDWHGKGVYTDDTQMTVAVMEALIDLYDPKAVLPSLFVPYFVNAYQRDPRTGYSKRMAALLEGGVADFAARSGAHSSGSGAAMRAIPCGLVAPDLLTAMKLARTTAETTHNTDEGILSAQAVAIVANMTPYASYPPQPGELDAGEIAEVLEEYCRSSRSPIPWREPWQGPVSSNGIEVVRAALTALHSSESLHEILKTAVSFTGDVDTVAALAVGLGALAGKKLDFPEALYQNLENEAYGKIYLNLLERFFKRALNIAY